MLMMNKRNNHCICPRSASESTLEVSAACSGASALALGAVAQNMIHSVNSDASDEIGLQGPVLDAWKTRQGQTPPPPRASGVQGGIVTQDKRSGLADLSL